MSRPRRLDGFAYLGAYRYSVTICTHGRRRALEDPAAIDAVLPVFLQLATRYAFAVLAYCVMPDHVHLLVEGRSDDADLRGFVATAKKRTGFAYARATGRTLWQSGFHERILRRDDDARVAARYIVNNPVRAGLVKAPSEYPYVGSDVWSMDELLGSI